MTDTATEPAAGPAEAPAPTDEPAVPEGMPATLDEALARFQAALPTITKTHTAEITSQRTGRTHEFDYADLADVSEVVLPPLGALGLSFTTKPTWIDGEPWLVYKLRHVSGQTDEGQYKLPKDATPHTMGMCITYARRHILCAMTGVHPAGEDDGGVAIEQGAQSAGAAFQQASRTRPERQITPARQEPKQDQPAAQNGQQPPAQQPAEPAEPGPGGNATAIALARLARTIACQPDSTQADLKAKVYDVAYRKHLLTAPVPDVWGDESQTVQLTAVISQSKERIPAGATQ